MSSSHLLVSVPDELVKSTLSHVSDRVEFVIWDMSGPAPATDIDIVVPPYLRPISVLERLKGLNVKLVQSLMVGYDGVEEVLPAGVTYANAASVHETSTAELTLALLLAAQRGIPDFVRAAERGHWAPNWHPSLADRRVLLIGYGGVGRAIESRLLPFEALVTRVASHERIDERGVIYGIESLAQLLPAAEVVIVAVPLTPATTHLVNDAFLSLLADGSLLVNVARGKVADTNALVEHARHGRLRLALDVVDPEPLPDGHPLFTMENVLISPHVGGASSAMAPRVTRLVDEQIARMLRGESPINVIFPREERASNSTLAVH
ncbi:MAG: 2-hydroxyacid dehydrogenase [Acidimicrobiales bacterium]